MEEEETTTLSGKRFLKIYKESSSGLRSQTQAGVCKHMKQGRRVSGPGDEAAVWTDACRRAAGHGHGGGGGGSCRAGGENCEGTLRNLAEELLHVFEPHITQWVVFPEIKYDDVSCVDVHTSLGTSRNYLIRLLCQERTKGIQWNWLITWLNWSFAVTKVYHCNDWASHDTSHSTE